MEDLLYFSKQHVRLRDLAQLAADLGQLRESADYQFSGTLTEAQRRSWLSVLARFGGEAIGLSLTEAQPSTRSAIRQSAPAPG